MKYLEHMPFFCASVNKCLWRKRGKAADHARYETVSFVNLLILI